MRRIVYVYFSIDGIRYQIQKDGNGKRAVYKIGDKRVSFWERKFGDAAETADFAGRKIIKSAHGDANSRYDYNGEYAADS
ncbi:MAG: hypothetical protein LBP62_08510 [Clostridiales bacterium]|jgi:hypothetical protein|nr:hypothetical protein [Clostridiales bacterium]